MIKAGVIGWPIQQSKSPIIHGYWLDKYGIAGQYERVGVRPDALARRLFELRDMGYIGLNVTAPHKEAVLGFMDNLSARAARIGAVNTITFENGKIHGDNTDGLGFINNLKSFPAGREMMRDSAFILGAGGAARAVLDGVIQEGFRKILIANRTRQRAMDLANDFLADSVEIHILDWQDISAHLSELSLLVNTTSLGMVGKGDSSPDLPLDISGLDKTALVTDIVYNPLKTNLLQRAETQGNPTIDGLGMLLHQAAPGFEKWFGARPEITDALRQKVMETL